MLPQIVIIHGGHVFSKREDTISYLKNKQVTANDFKPAKSWRENLANNFGKDFELFYPKMPNGQDAKYEEWKTWFEKLIPFLHDDVILVGHSLGGLLLIKYLSENEFPKKIRALFTVATPYTGRNMKHSREMGGTFTPGNDLSGVTRQVNKLFMYHSKEDPVVPFADFEMYQTKLSGATARVFENRGHFNMETLPEIVEDIKELEK